MTEIPPVSQFETSDRLRRDRGIALPMTLVVAFVLGVMVVGVATYGTANLRYGRATEERSDQLAAADAAMRYAVDLLRIGAAPCIYSTQEVNLPALPTQFNGASGSVRCDTIGGGLTDSRDYAVAVTGANVPLTEALIVTQGGSVPKKLTGPVFMSRVSNAFDLSVNAGIEINRGPLLYTAGPGCTTILKWYTGAPAGTTLPRDVSFEPDFQFNPLCVAPAWYDFFDAFDEPPIAAGLDALALRDGGVPTTPLGASAWSAIGVVGAYNINAGGCYVFEPGHYVRPPVVPPNKSAYFKSGTYWFDFRDPATATPGSLAAWGSAPRSGAGFKINRASVTVGNRTGIPLELPNPTCNTAKNADGVGGATIYTSGTAHIEISNQGALELLPAVQGVGPDARPVAIHALCSQTAVAGYPATNNEASWCTASPTATAAPRPSTLVAPASNAMASTNPSIVYTEPGNNREMVAHGLIYAPLAQMEFGNVTNTATQKMKGGLTVARVILQASTSAQNFEIGVSTSTVDSVLKLTSTGTKNGRSTQIVAIAELAASAYYQDAIALNSWRVCEGAC